VNSGNLDLLATFDVVDHHAFLQRLQVSCALGGIVMMWFTTLHFTFLRVNYSTIRDAILRCAQKLSQLNLPHGTKN